ncbi:MAG TPA: cytochrome C oxidase subunit IV family protein [Ilumatobacteraceae bacterium]|jgi:cytochrome c oxidase subunit 4
MTTTDHTEHTGHDDHVEHTEPHAHKPNSFYIKVAAALAVITGVEVGLYYLDLGKLYLPVLLVLMAVKFLTVVSLFMHLKFDNKIFSWLFYTGLGLAVFVYVAALMTFRFFDGS